MKKQDRDLFWNKKIDVILDNINRHGYYIMKHSEIHDEKVEPRLIAYMDNSSALPELFKNNNLSMMSNTNKSYVIFKDRLLKTYPKIKDIIDNAQCEEYNCSFDSKFIMLKNFDITSESMAINFAHFISLLNTFTNDKLYLLLNGKQRANYGFDIKLPDDNIPINILGSQIEMDAVYEGERNIYLFEVKNRRLDDFNIRQLYLPFKYLSSKYQSKEIIPILFIRDNNKFYLIQFKFGDIFGDLQCVKSRCYIIKLNI